MHTDKKELLSRLMQRANARANTKDRQQNYVSDCLIPALDGLGLTITPTASTHNAAQGESRYCTCQKRSGYIIDDSVDYFFAVCHDCSKPLGQSEMTTTPRLTPGSESPSDAIAFAQWIGENWFHTSSIDGWFCHKYGQIKTAKELYKIFKEENK